AHPCSEHAQGSDARLTHEPPNNSPCPCRDNRLPASDSVDAIHEIYRVDQAHDPEEGQRNTDPPETQLTEDGQGHYSPVAETPECDRRGDSVDGEAQADRHARDVVTPAHACDQQARRGIDQE